MSKLKQQRGQRGESAAAQYLAALGMEILVRNWRCRAGEIDIIARDGGTLVIVEVKYRSSDTFGSPEESVTGSKQRRLRTLARCWLAESDRHWAGIRFDVLAVLRIDMGRGAPASSITHYVDAF